jgi:hypothetical protein
MGPCGGLGGLEAEVSEGHPVSLRQHHVAQRTRALHHAAKAALHSTHRVKETMATP